MSNVIDKKPVKNLSNAINFYNEIGHSFNINSIKSSYELYNAFNSHNNNLNIVKKKKKKPSKLINLPLQFVSNAKPVDVITGKSS